MQPFSSPHDQTPRLAHSQKPTSCPAAERTPGQDAVHLSNADLSAPPASAPTESIPGYITIQMTLPEFPDELSEESPVEATAPHCTPERLADLFPFDLEDQEELPDVLPEFITTAGFPPPAYESSSPSLPEHVTLEMSMQSLSEDTVLPNSYVSEDAKGAILKHRSLAQQQSSLLPSVADTIKPAAERLPEETFLP